MNVEIIDNDGINIKFINTEAELVKLTEKLKTKTGLRGVAALRPFLRWPRALPRTRSRFGAARRSPRPVITPYVGNNKKFVRLRTAVKSRDS